MQKADSEGASCLLRWGYACAGSY